MNMNQYGVTSLLASLYGIFLSVFIYIKRRNSLEGVLFSLFAFFVSTWCLVPFVRNVGEGHLLVLFFIRLLTAAGIFVPPVALQFAYVLVDEHKTRNAKFILRLCYCISLLFSINVFSPFFIKSVDFSVAFYRIKPGLLYTLFLVYFTVVNAYALYVLLRTYKIIQGRKKSQIKYFFIALFTAYISGSMHVFSTYFKGGEPFSHDIFLVFYLTILAYSIIRYRLMEIDTVIHRTILWFVTLVFLVTPMSMIIALLKYWLISLTLVKTLLVVSMLLVFFVLYYNRFKPVIDHMFRRRKYDYHKVLAEMGERIGTELDINKVVDRLFRELKEILYIRNGIVFVQGLEQKDYQKIGSIVSQNAEAAMLVKENIIYTGRLSQWLHEYKKALEREQIEINPHFEPIREEALPLFNRYGIEIFIPMIMENNINGLVGLGKKENLQPYTTKDIELLEKMGRQIGVTIDNALHHEDIIEKERMEEELKVGREIQMNLLPKQVPDVPHLFLAGLMRPAKEIGGDYYDFITLPNKDEIAIVIGDVSGKGVGAGLLMSMAKATISAISQEEISPKQILLRTNSFLYQQVEGQKFMTLLYFKWRAQSRTFSYSSAGHEHILIYRTAIKEVEAVPGGGFMLGMLPDIETFLEEKEITFTSGDKILLYTDGVTDANNQREERFGLSQLKESFKRNSQKPASELIAAIKDEIYGFVSNQPQYDDITLVVMEIH